MRERTGIALVDAVSLPSVVSNRIFKMTPQAIEKVRELDTILLQYPQVPIQIGHVIHAGMYARTAFVPAGTTVTGVLVKVGTILIVHGDVTVFIGDEPLELTGYNVIPASGGRKQAFVARSDVWLTMILVSGSSDVEGAERDFTDEYDLLASHRDAEVNVVTITGE